MRQIKPAVLKLKQFKYFFRRMDDLTQKNQGICGKASEMERQLRDRGACEELMAKLSHQEERAMEEEQAKQRRRKEEIREEGRKEKAEKRLGK